jgi:hypothetical protein
MEKTSRTWRDWLTPVLELSSNWISAAGVVLVTASGLMWLMLVFSGAGHATANPYLGILLFMVLPGIFFLGLALIPAGIWCAAAARECLLRRPSISEVRVCGASPCFWRPRHF